MDHNYEGCDCGRCKWIRESQAQNLRDGYAPKMSMKERLAKQRQENYEASERAFDMVQKRKAALKVHEWQPIKANYPVLIYETQNKMDDFNASDMVHGNESRKTIESYGFMQPFKNEMVYSPSRGHDVVTEDQFSLSADEHFQRMRELGVGVGFSMFGKTSDIFLEMVDKFQRNEGGYYSNPLLDEALQQHETTKVFNKTLLDCLGMHVTNGILDSNIVGLASGYMSSSRGVGLPHFDEKKLGDLLNGTVLTVHGIWSMRVYAEKLEYKGDQIRGVFRYEVQDHFGLDTADINHPDLIDENSDLTHSLPKKFEQLEGFRSWYLLQHYVGYDYQPFITEIKFTVQ